MRSVVDCCGFSISKDRSGGENQDCFICETGLDWADAAIIVTDGVGSSAAPRDAALAAARSWMIHAKAKFVENAAKCADFDDVHFDEITVHAFSQAHETVQRDTKGSACGASVCLQGNRLLVGNVGDCRIYRIASGTMEQLSEDQVDAAGDPTQVLGGKRIPQAYTASGIQVHTGDIILLCTDGATKLLEPPDMQQSAGAGSAQAIAGRLQKLIESRRKPGSDDATAVVAVIKKVGVPFWEISTDLGSGDVELKEDLIEMKLNEVLAELLNRIRTPLERQNIKAEQALGQLNEAVEGLRSEVESLRTEAGHMRVRGKPTSGDWQSGFIIVALSAILLIAGMLIGWTVKDSSAGGQALRLQLPEQSKVVSQEYTSNDRLLVRFLGRDGKKRLAVFRLEDGGKPFAIIDEPASGKSNVSVP